MACDDGNLCTCADTCQGGVCVGVEVLCAEPDSCHDAGYCAPETGKCRYPRLSDGTACEVDAEEGACSAGVCIPGDTPAENCDDGNACTIDSFVDGECVYTPVECPQDDADQCHENVCNPDSGACEAVVLVGQSCDDGLLCSESASCNEAGECVATGSTNCDDNDCCTVDSCDPLSGCSHEPVDCNDNNPCTIDSCDSASGCVHENKPDGHACTKKGESGTCMAGVCCV